VERNHGAGAGQPEPGVVGIGVIQITPQMRILVAYSGPCRSPFRDDGDHDSGVMPIRIPG